jgi:hypothetical protein
MPWIETCDTFVWRFYGVRLACFGGKVIAYNQRDTLAQSEAGK